MIIRLSSKLAKKIHVKPPAVVPADKNLYADWSTHLFTCGRTQYIIITNTASLYSAVMYGKGINNDSTFIKKTMNLLNEILTDDGFSIIFHNFIDPASETISFSKALNRSVTGSITELIYQAQLHIAEDGMSPYDVSDRLNGTLLSYIGYATPKEAFRNLLTKKKDNSKK
ncbi:hypothetical protein KAJ27_15155 [bacterium]|nr:hypothetical protein [bacterium]